VVFLIETLVYCYGAKKSLIYYSLATTDVLDEKHRNKQSILTFWAQVVLAFVSSFAGPISPISV
jgi:hypothetical protein